MEHNSGQPVGLYWETAGGMHSLSCSSSAVIQAGTAIPSSTAALVNISPRHQLRDQIFSGFSMLHKDVAPNLRENNWHPDYLGRAPGPELQNLVTSLVGFVVDFLPLPLSHFGGSEQDTQPGACWDFQHSRQELTLQCFSATCCVQLSRDSPSQQLPTSKGIFPAYIFKKKICRNSAL